MKNFLSIFLIAFIAPLSIFSQDDCSPEMVMDLVNQTLFEGDAPLPEGAEMNFSVNDESVDGIEGVIEILGTDLATDYTVCVEYTSVECPDPLVVCEATNFIDLLFGGDDWGDDWNDDWNDSTDGDWDDWGDNNDEDDYNGEGQVSSIESINSEINISLYPMPAKDNFTVEGLPEGNWEAMIFDSYGRIVSNQLISNFQRVDLSYLANGYYTIHMLEFTGISKRFVIQK